MFSSLTALPLSRPPRAANLVDNEFLLFVAVRKLRDTDGVLLAFSIYLEQNLKRNLLTQELHKTRIAPAVGLSPQ
jgi:hypothetical protein